MLNQPDPLHLMALVAHQSGVHDSAMRQIKLTLAVTPDNASLRNNLAMMWPPAATKTRALRSIACLNNSQNITAPTTILLTC